MHSWEWRTATTINEGATAHQLWSTVTRGGQGGIRSPLYPMLFVPLYWILAQLGLDGGPMLVSPSASLLGRGLLSITPANHTLACAPWNLQVLAPRLVQAVFAAATDIAVMRIADRVLGEQYGLAAVSLCSGVPSRFSQAPVLTQPHIPRTVQLFCSLGSFFNFHTSTRTFSNSMETALTTLAIALWPWPGRAKSDEQALSAPQYFSSLAFSLGLAAIACVMRPSNAIIWLTLGGHLLATHAPNPEGVYILSLATFIGVFASILCFLVDTAFYSTPTFTPLRFLHENVFHSISLFYGSNSSHFYLTQGIPIMTMTQLPFLLHGLWLVFIRSDARGRGLAPLGIVVSTTVILFSLLGHKEWRFLHPILPILHLFVAFSLVTLHTSRLGLAKSTTATKLSTVLHVRTRHLALILASLIPGLYFTCFHSIAQVTILDHLRYLPTFEVRSVGFLMPCHSTPWQSHLHRRDLELGGLRSGEGGLLWFITCEPPIGLDTTSTAYRDQSDYFYASPSNYLTQRFPSEVDPTFPPTPFQTQEWQHTWPSHLVFFETLLDQDPEVAKILKGVGYEEEERRWNSLWHDDGRRRGDVVVWKWRRTTTTRSVE
ncbi:BQ5605_C013g07112 [Microbotryum silenes-dioicae]|uniref:Mannosyltransferase n=1 Tax=Microbotryum silenes-dioicae TaxID=796604 RepID=A0A2X0LQY0_9BASI|nr:BQ5605_C013g07112 [Microbotryum silenes-dioicae]